MKKLQIIFKNHNECKLQFNQWIENENIQPTKVCLISITYKIDLIQKFYPPHLLNLIPHVYDLEKSTSIPEKYDLLIIFGYSSIFHKNMSRFSKDIPRCTIIESLD